MRLGHLLNVLAHNSIYLVDAVRILGMRGLVRFVRDTLSSPCLDVEITTFMWYNFTMKQNVGDCINDY
jgi:hypothetical protein